MRTLGRKVAAVTIMGVALATVAGCSTARDAVDPVLWRQVDAAENAMYRSLLVPGAASPQAIFDSLSAALVHWDGKTDPSSFSEDQGSAVFYDYHEQAGGVEAAFELFVVSGRSHASPGPALFGAAPARIYTCYQIGLTFEAGVAKFSRGADDGRLECPRALVDMAGEDAQYRVPWVFDG